MAFEQQYFICFLLVLLQLPFFTIAQSYKNISFSSSLTAQEDSDPHWASPSGEFAFGFRKIGNAGFLLAIWFENIQEKTIVWSANRNNPVQEGSSVEFSAEGKLTLTDIGTGKPTNIADGQSTYTGVAYAAMLDKGIFVLATRNSTYLWQSFDHPTDTILPTQTLNLNSSLFAQLTATNYSEGIFKFVLDSDGNLMLYTVNYPLKSNNFIYWPIQTGGGFQVSVEKVQTQDNYQRATLDYDGVLRHYIHQKSTDSWSTFTFTPPNICTAIVEYTGGGACGFNSLCIHDEDAAHTKCLCPLSYIPVDRDDERKGCKQNFVPQSCDKASSETDLFEFQELPFTDWPGGDYEHFQPVNKEQCKQSCLADCFCAIAIFNEGSGDCWKKRIPLSNGKINDDVKGLALIEGAGAGVDAANWRYGMLGSGGGVLQWAAGLCAARRCRVSGRRRWLELQGGLEGGEAECARAGAVNPLNPVVQGMNLKCFTFMELKEATNGFEEELGRGAFATVFKGVLASDNGKFIAVKRLNTVVKENDLEFKAEVSAIGGTNHRNLVQLLGFCNEGQHQLLVYEYMSNGSLASFLFGESRPNWNTRKKIALGTAGGLLYLHEECSSQIIHCDIKPQNILLDYSFTARIADFGVAKLLKSDQTRTTTRIRGTKGYVAPEWFKSLPVTVKVDVYSYGMVLLEIVCCRKNYEPEAPAEDQMILADWAYDCYKKKKVHLLWQNVGDDQEMDGIEKLEKYLMIAFWCIQEDPSARPTIKKVTRMLEGTVEVSVPPNLSSLYVQYFNISDHIDPLISG
ncbi:G-type lectin S-receptor-like serine/threonine-protein kinase LECRK3 [Rosa chinensis]|uniref:G-type lectin S-receptor-like serine/threonine-protein kinase LECRK3 n=1 Tax=Rosa chinensis TaxID=74649 RepID=UPI000D08F5D9|nr:G-type lectin S-receptor-like serine/threonine-protein kinase LECRK3 [Rosa chinensis]